MNTLKKKITSIEPNLTIALIILLFLYIQQISLWTQELNIIDIDRNGNILWENPFQTAVITIQYKDKLTQPWQTGDNYFATNQIDKINARLENTNRLFRLAAVDISTNSPNHFTNLIYSYGILETIAGKYTPPGEQDQVNSWQPEFKGGPATNASLSRPHIAFADPYNNIILVDEGSDSVLKITTNGTIHTYAGTHVRGFNGDGPSPATNLNLYLPNGGWMLENGTFYILDRYNKKVRRVDTNGIMTTVFTTTVAINRGLWVKSDESEIYFSATTTVYKWTPTGGVAIVRSGFSDLANIQGDEQTGNLYISDRNTHRIYMLTPEGNLTTIAGNGTTTGGGDGFPATVTGLNRPRMLWFLPNNGFLICEHDPGNRIWYVDPAGIIHLWLNGDRFNTPGRGDGEWFYNNPSSPKVSKVRSVALDKKGNIIIVESDMGYIRKINFSRLYYN
ncbi:MAG: hypothetical protein N2487_02760 [Verrucomicrobiae bacterium]|nr:hypothetical protein [Verrucomicrobiae bacterium]